MKTMMTQDIIHKV